MRQNGLLTCFLQALPNGVEPIEMLGLHEDGAQAGNRVTVGMNLRIGGSPEGREEFGDGKVKVEFGGFGEDSAREGGGFGETGGARGEDYDIEFRREGGHERGVGLDSRIQLPRRIAGALEAVGHGAA